MFLMPTLLYAAIPYLFAWWADGKGDVGFAALSLRIIVQVALPFVAIGNLIVAFKPWKSHVTGVLAAFGFTLAACAAIYVTSMLRLRS